MHARFKVLINLGQYLIEQVLKHNLFNLASTLAFTTLLASVPLFTVIFAFISHLPFFQDMGQDLNHFVLSYFLPDVGADIESLLSGFISNALKMQSWGFIFLIVTAVMLLSTIDKAIHVIWNDGRKRSALWSLVIYWLVLVITPLTLALSIATSSYLSTLNWLQEVPIDIGLGWALIFPWLMTTLGLMMLYKTIPSEPVLMKHALIAAVFAALLFELSKRLFSLYIAHFPVQEAIFGALAAFPLILIWLFVTWLVILLGAEVCHALGTDDWRE
jgi:membrane protein